MKAKQILVFLLASTLIFSCGKDDNPPTPVAETPTTPTSGGGNTNGSAQPSFADADATLWAVKSITTVSGFPFTIGIGVGTFFDNSGNFVSAGNVQLNNNALTLNANNSYAFTPGLTTPNGIVFTSNVDWDVTGGNGFSAFTKNVTLGFPTVTEITSAATVTKANDYTVTVNTVSGADSVLFLVGGVDKTIAGNATSCTFTANELSSLANGGAAVQVAAYITTNEMVSGKKVYYGNETVQSLTVTIQ